jgi:hypothetical protein
MNANAYLLLAIVLFCLGTVFQFNGGVFGDPYMQQIALVATWLPVTLVVLRHYYYNGLALTNRVASDPPDATSQPVSCK